ncbi:MAG: hypothetical protein JOS17DRAFT_308557 [Linnemannia elongata]|nr:MAG: hypothetical protein JOS17DRAFT_308557 [Linnemannia elongata]
MLLLLAACLMGYLGQAGLAGFVLQMPFAHSSFELVSSFLFFFSSAILFGLMHGMSDDERRQMQLGHNVVWEGEKKEGKKHCGKGIATICQTKRGMER